jgi:hypothetical protein
MPCSFSGAQKADAESVQRIDEHVECGWHEIIQCCIIPRTRNVNEICTCPEWWHTTQQDVDDHTSTPDISLGAISLFQDLWCDVVGATDNIRE